MRFVGTIFVEGVADLKFIKDFVKWRFDYDLEDGREIQEVEGKDKLGQYVPQFQISSDLQITNLLIFDANGSCQERLNELNQKKEELHIKFETFLFPNNDDPGDLETLLENIINPDNEFIFECFDGFNNCITQVEGQLYPLNRKTKIHTYVSVLVEDNDLAKERNRHYLNTVHWNLESEYLNPLATFLQPYFVNDNAN